MAKTKIKIIVGIFLFLIISLIGAAFYISSKITPEEVRRHGLTFLQQTFPKADIQLGEVNYSLGTSVKFKLHNLSMKLKDSPHTPLAQVAMLDVKVPLWAILTRGGTIGINIDAPVLHYVVLSDEMNNWKKAMNLEQQRPERADVSTSTGESSTVAVPGALSRGQIDIKLTNLVLKYALLNKSKGEIEISRLFIKNLNLNDPTAFEVATQVRQKNAQGEEFSVDAVLIGQVNIRQYLDDQELSSSMVLNITSAKLPGIKKELSALKADLKLHLHKDGNVDVTLDAGLGNFGVAKLQAHVQKEKLRVEHIDVDLSLKEILDFLGKSELVNSESARVKLKGEAELAAGEIAPNLDFTVVPAANIMLAPKVRMDFTALGSVNKNSLALKVNGKLLQGSLDVNLQGPLNLKATRLEDKLGTLNVQLGVNNIQIPKEDLHELIYKKKNEDSVSENKPSSSGKTEKSRPVPAPEFPRIVANIKWNNISVGGEPFQGEMKLATQKNSIVSDNLRFTFSKGKGNVKFLTTLLAQNAQTTKLDAQIQSLNLDGFMPFLPKNLESLKGSFSGQVKGDIETHPAKQVTNYNLQVNVNARDGEIKKLNVADYVKDVVSGVPILKDKISKEGINLTNKFESLDLNGNFRQNHFQISKFSFISNKGQLIANGHGEIYPLPNSAQSYLEFEISDRSGKLSQELKKNIGQESLPLRVEGPQYSLKPDLAYTLKKVSKGALKTQGKEQLKKFGEKLMEEKKDELKNLFKGFLKK